MSLADHAFYAALWLSFALGHSFLAHEPLRRAWKALFGHGARLAYNAVALIHILAVAAVGRFVLFAEPAFVVPAPVVALQLGLALAGGVLLLVAARSYDMGRFSGLHQLRHRTDDAPPPADPGEDEEPLHTGGLHARIRHPLYSAGMLLLWGLAHDEAGIATALWGTLYFLIGARCEEHRLIRLFGERYRAYRRQVPAYMPRLFGS